MDTATRRALLELCAKYHIPIIEDDVYSRTYLNSRPVPPSLMSLQQHTQVISISTFSKVLAPGLRVGWIVAPPYMVKQLSLMKMRANLFTEGLNQLVLSELIDHGDLDLHLQRMRRHHKCLRDTAVSVATRAAKKGLLSFNCPSGSLYLWCKLNRRMDTDDLLAALYKQGVSVAPGYAFFLEKPAETYIRVCFTAAPASGVMKGMEILTDTLGRFASESQTN